jgi:hypothetical protein
MGVVINNLLKVIYNAFHMQPRRFVRSTGQVRIIARSCAKSAMLRWSNNRLIRRL